MKKPLSAVGRALQRAAPWRHLDESTPLHLSVARRAIAPVLVVVDGVYGPRGFALYQSEADFRMVARGGQLRGGLIIFDISGREPVLVAMSSNGLPRSLEEDELALAIRCAKTLAAFDAEAAARGLGATAEVDDLRLTCSVFASSTPLRAAETPAIDRRSRWIRLGEPLNEQLHRLGASLPEWRPTLADLACESPGYTEAHLVQLVQLAGATVADRFLARHAHELSPEQLRWFAAHREAWTSIWDVTAVEPGRSITLRDIFSGESRCVIETGASQSVVVHDHVLARVVTVGDESFVDIMYHRTLSAAAAQVVRERFARVKRWPKVKPVALAKLRAPFVWIDLADEWEGMLAESMTPPQLQTLEGDELVHVTLRYPIVGPVSSLSAALATLPGAAEMAPGAWIVERSPEPALGTLNIVGGELEAITLSRESAATLADLLATHGGALLGRARREEQAAADLMQRAQDQGPGPRPAPSLDEQELVRALKDQHYASWPDQPLPALSGKTPIEAVKTAAGRRLVTTLLNDLERTEARHPPGTRYDVAGLRQRLGLS